MNNFLKTAYTAGAQQALVDFGIEKTALSPAALSTIGHGLAGAAGGAYLGGEDRRLVGALMGGMTAAGGSALGRGYTRALLSENKPALKLYNKFQQGRVGGSDILAKLKAGDPAATAMKVPDIAGRFAVPTATTAGTLTLLQQSGALDPPKKPEPFSAQALKDLVGWQDNAE
jgi:hypothetical protein